MRQIQVLLVAVALAGTTGLLPVGWGSVELAAAGEPQQIRQPATLTGVLEFRTFFRDCQCYPWAIDKGGRSWEVDVSRVQTEAQAFEGRRVRATGRWSSYQRDGQTIRYLIVTRLEAV